MTLGRWRSKIQSLRGWVTNGVRHARQREVLFKRFPDAIFGEGVMVVGEDRFYPGKRLFIDHRAYLNCAGGLWNGYRGYIRLGDNVEIGPYCVLWGAGGITIGSNVHIGAHVSISAHEARQIPPSKTDTFTPLEFDFAPVIIEDHVLICSGTVIVPGVKIGHHAMIGGGSVVTKDIPPYALAAGCPARVLRSNGPDVAGSTLAVDSAGGWDPLNLSGSGPE